MFNQSKVNTNFEQKGEKMELTKKQFCILEALATSKSILTQRDLEKTTEYSLGTINRTVKELNDLGYMKDGAITEAGIEALEPYRVKRAIFIAAGFGSRLVPLTLNTPKPLIRVRGKRMIDTLLDAVVAAGIEEIYIVRGYLGEQFDQLLYKYPQVKFIDNPLYNECNNISSALCVRHLLQNAYVLESDLVLSNHAIIKKYHYTSNFLGMLKDRTDDWCFAVKDGFITEQKVGGLDCYQAIGISYWNETDGKKLSEHIKEAFYQPGGKELYWDQLPFRCYPNDYKVAIRECKEGDIIEIDTFKELKAIDKTYDI